MKQLLLSSTFAFLLSACLLAQSRTISRRITDPAMKNLLLLAALLAALCHPVSTSSQVIDLDDNTTRAVVIGISDYQDEGITDLRFADKDAEAFANFLRSPAGGSLDADHLKLLTNQAATTAQFDAALGWLMDESEEGDQAIIYFSGHGDVETRTRSQHGFLLCWDSPPHAYVSGAYPIFYLKDVVSTLSLENKARVIIITDACRSGKLAGNSIGGSQLTSQNLAQQFANEIKILSCQPNEYSIEGEQWGGGRGAFSFHLVDGLYGLADGNADASVNLLEIGRYLDDHVTTEVAPQSQVPMTVGNRTEKLAAVFPDLLAQVKKNKAGQLPTFSPTETRGIEDDVLATVDTTVRKLYRMFKQALKDKVFLEPTDACADAYYVRLIAEPKLERLHNAMRRNYAAALQDDAQQAVNAMMNNSLDEFNLAQGRKEKYKSFSRQLGRAAELLGEHHYFYPSLMARKWLFEGYLVHHENMYFKDEGVGRKALRYYWKALEWQPEFPLAYIQIGMVYKRNIPKPDSVEYFARQALKLAPRWATPYYDISELLQDSGRLDEALVVLDSAFVLDSNGIIYPIAKGQIYRLQKRFEEAEQMYLQAIALDSNVVQGPQNLAFLYKQMGEYNKAEKLFLKVIEMDSLLSNPNLQKAWDYGNLGGLYTDMGLFSKAEENLVKALQYDENVAFLWHNLGGIYLQLNKIAEAEPVIKKQLELAPDRLFTLKNLGTLHFRKGEVDEARSIFENIIGRYPHSYPGFLGMAGIYAKEGNLKLAIEFTEKAFQCSNHCIPLKHDFDLAPIRDTLEFKALVENYCPEKVKD